MSNEVLFMKELERLVNKYGFDSKFNTPDYILAEFMYNSLESYGTATGKNIRWHGWKTFGENEMVKESK